MDNKSAEQRRENMSRIRSSNTKPEETVRKFLFSRGFRYRKNDKRYPGKPDVVLPKYRTLIYINGCFWHQHTGCKYAAIPKSNQEYWLPKLARNTARDEAVHKEAIEAGWNVVVVWECSIKGKLKNYALNALTEYILISPQIAGVHEILTKQEEQNV